MGDTTQTPAEDATASTRAAETPTSADVGLPVSAPVRASAPVAARPSALTDSPAAEGGSSLRQKLDEHRARKGPGRPRKELELAPAPARRTRGRRTFEPDPPPSTASKPVDGLPVAPPPKPAETKQQAWTRERARIGAERADWQMLVGATVAPVIAIAAHAFVDLDLSRAVVSFPTWERDGSAGRFVGPADEGLAVMLGQCVAAGVRGGEVLQHPLAVPIMAALVVSTQLVQLFAMKKLGITQDQLDKVAARMGSTATAQTEPAPTPPPNGAHT